MAHRVERVRDDDENRWGECLIASFVTAETIASFVATRSSRLMPGDRGLPAVMTTTSEPAVSS